MVRARQTHTTIDLTRGQDQERFNGQPLYRLVVSQKPCLVVRKKSPLGRGNVNLFCFFLSKLFLLWAQGCFLERYLLVYFLEYFSFKGQIILSTKY